MQEVIVERDEILRFNKRREVNVRPLKSPSRDVVLQNNNDVLKVCPKLADR